MSTPLVFRGIRKLLGVGPPDEVLPVDGDGGKSPAGDQPVDVGPRHASQFCGSANANVLVGVDSFCHAPIVADRIQQASREDATFRNRVTANR